MKRTVFFRYAQGIFLTVVVSFAAFTIGLAQKPVTPVTDPKQPSKESKTTDTKPGAKPSFVLTVKTKPILNISLKADKARMSEVAEQLSKKLKTPVFLGAQQKNELLTLEFSELTLEPALQLMSPQVYLDYEIETGSMTQKPLGIFFYDAQQGEPPVTAVVNATSYSMLVEGNTEDGVEPATDEEKEEQPLRIVFRDNLLSVKAKKQPLPVVLLKIGEQLGIPVDIQQQEIAIVDTEISKLPVEDVVRQLSPHIRLFLRADLTRAERRALRMVLAEPVSATQQNP